MKLSEHFGLQEFTVSETAARQGIDNTPSPEVVENLKRLAAMLEEVRMLLGVPLHITSGYRSPELNKAIGGSKTSVHCHGLAADFIAAHLPIIEACEMIAASDLVFDQLIYEHTWIHLGLADIKPRRQVLTLRDGGYVPGIVA